MAVVGAGGVADAVVAAVVAVVLVIADLKCFYSSRETLLPIGLILTLVLQNAD